MWKTLACLVGAMIGTAGLLGWIDPSSPSTERVTPDQIVRMARSAVMDDVRVRRGRWEEIEVVPVSQAAGDGPLLTAGPPPDDCHFQIDRLGRILPADAWLTQEAETARPHTVRIQVYPAAAGTLSAAQRLCINAVANAIQERLSQPERLPVRLTSQGIRP